MYETWASHSRTLWFYMCNLVQLSDRLADLEGRRIALPSRGTGRRTGGINDGEEGPMQTR